MPFEQILSLVGAAMILFAFTANTTGRLDVRSPTYLVLNMVGAALLTYTAIVGRQWGFIVLEGTWSLVAAVGLWRVLRRRSANQAR